MAYRIEVTRRAAKQLSELAAADRKRVARRISALTESPHPKEARKLSGADDLWRIRVGDWRIIYVIHDDQLIIVIAEVEPRARAYRNL